MTSLPVCLIICSWNLKADGHSQNSHRKCEQYRKVFVSLWGFGLHSWACPSARPGNRLLSHLGDSLGCPLQKPCSWYWKGRGYFLQKKRMNLPCSTSEPGNRLEAFPIRKEGHPSCPIQAVILSGLVLSCYAEPFSSQLFQRSKAHNNRAIAFVTCTTGILSMLLWLPFLCCSNSLTLC